MRLTGSFQADATDDNADWNKHSWDFPPEIDSAEKMREFLAGPFRCTVEHFKALPVYRFNVGKIEWLNDL